MNAFSMIIGGCYCEIYLPESRSLKDKRQIVKSICQKIKNQLPVAVAEVAYHEQWQRCGIGLAAVSADKLHAEKLLRQAVDLMEKDCRLHLSQYHLYFY